MVHVMIQSQRELSQGTPRQHMNDVSSSGSSRKSRPHRTLNEQKSKKSERFLPFCFGFFVS